MNFNQIIVNVMVLFMVVAAIDKCLGSRSGLGDQIDEALGTMGPMCIPMVGMILMAPLMGSLLLPVIEPVYAFLGADPAMFATSVLACDMGGYPLAQTLAKTPEAAQFAGCILGTSLGGAISFLIPVGLGMVRKELHPYFALGTLIGIATTPIDAIVGGLAAGYSPAMVLRNTSPILILAVIIALGIWKAQAMCIKLFTIFGRLLVILSVSGFAIGIIQELTSLTLIDGLTPVLDGIKVVGSVVIVLCGAYPLLKIVADVCRKFLQRIGSWLGIDQVAAASILGGLANVMPVLNNCNKMSPAGVVVAVAFAVSGSCILGDHLGFIASVDQSMILPMILAKLAGFVSAMAVAVAVCKKSHISCEIPPAAAAQTALSQQ